MHKGEARVNLGGVSFLDCILQLEWIQTTGTVTILNSDGATTMVVSNPDARGPRNSIFVCLQHSFALSDITCVQMNSEPGGPRLAIHTPRNYPAIVILQFSSDTLLEEWQTHLVSTCEKLRDIQGKCPKDGHNSGAK